MSRQFQFVHGNFNLFMAISIYSRQFQFVHGNFNSLTAISIYSRQFQFAHGNFNYCLTVSVPVPYCTVSQNASISIPHINSSIEATSKSCLLMLLVAVFLFLLKKSKNCGAIRRNMLSLWTRSEIRFLFGGLWEREVLERLVYFKTRKETIGSTGTVTHFVSL